MNIVINWKDLQKRIINWQEVTKVIRNGVQIRPESVPPVTDDYLCFTAPTGAYITLNKIWTPTEVSLEISTDKENWSDYTIGTQITMQWNSKLYFRNKSTTPTGFSTSGSNYYNFSSVWSTISVSWDLNYLLCKTSTDTVWSYCFFKLFADRLQAHSYIQDASNLDLSATTLNTHCYERMFDGCVSLTTAPNTLPATTCATSCYAYMFNWCTALTNSPLLPATTLANSCYSRMFSWCTNLETLPSLSATTLIAYCYEYMFNGCSKIKISETQVWDYTNSYTMPSDWPVSWLNRMFTSTWWTFTWTPTRWTTYYTSNTIV